jgi:hypothetical protein
MQFYVVKCSGGFYVLNGPCVPKADDATRFANKATADNAANTLNGAGWCGGNCKSVPLQPQVNAMTDTRLGASFDVVEHVPAKAVAGGKVKPRGTKKTNP